MNKKPEAALKRERENWNKEIRLSEENIYCKYRLRSRENKCLMNLRYYW